MMIPNLEMLFSNFWQRYPALLYGLSILLGFFLSFTHSLLILFPFGFLLIPIMRHRRAILALVFFFSSWAYGEWHYTFPNVPEEGTAGTARIVIDSFSSRRSHFGKSWVYQCTLISFVPSGETKSIASHIPCTIHLPVIGISDPPPADSDYILECRLKRDANANYRLIVKKDIPWHPIKNTWSAAQIRYEAKQNVSHWIRRHITDSRAAIFLIGIATGSFDDRLMSHAFGRFGVQHIMAISGFHFSIIAGILSLVLSLIFSQRWSSMMLVFLLSSYFIFLGGAPSILRSWLAILTAIFGAMIGKRPSGLNSLGVGLMTVLIINPLSCQNIGFQFSFLATAAILIFFNPCLEAIDAIFKKRALQEMTMMDAKNQHGYFILSFFKQGAALGFAVNVITLPLVLLYFHKFPWLSLFYNLFFPFMVSISMLLLILAAMFTFPFTGIGNFFHMINNAYTPFMLNFTYNLPLSVDIIWRVKVVPIGFIVIFLTLIFAGGILLTNKREEKAHIAF